MKKILSEVKWADLYVILSHEDTELLFYNSGMISISGDVKCGAIAFAKHILRNHAFMGNLNYLCMSINLQKNTINWGDGRVKITSEIDLYPEPKFWKEFKREFERYCALKAFL